MSLVTYNRWIEDIAELARLYGHDKEPNPELCLQLIKEETTELIQAMELEFDISDIAKEIVDVLVVTIGAALSYRIPLETIWQIVHNSNMAKAEGPFDPKTNKKLKPKGWVDPKERIIEAIEFYQETTEQQE